MYIEQRITMLEDEFSELREELKQIMLDIRTFLMEADSPLRSDSDSDDFAGTSL